MCISARPIAASRPQPVSSRRRGASPPSVLDIDTRWRWPDSFRRRTSPRCRCRRWSDPTRRARCGRSKRRAALALRHRSRSIPVQPGEPSSAAREPQWCDGDRWRESDTCSVSENRPPPSCWNRHRVHLAASRFESPTAGAAAGRASPRNSGLTSSRVKLDRIRETPNTARGRSPGTSSDRSRDQA